MRIESVQLLKPSSVIPLQQRVAPVGMARSLLFKVSVTVRDAKGIEVDLVGIEALARTYIEQRGPDPYHTQAVPVNGVSAVVSLYEILMHCKRTGDGTTASLQLHGIMELTGMYVQNPSQGLRSSQPSCMLPPLSRIITIRTTRRRRPTSTSTNARLRTS